MQPMSDTHAGSDPAVHSSAAADEPSPPARGKPVLTPGTAPDAGGARSSRRRSPAEPQPAGAVTPAIGDTRPAPRIGDTRPAPAVGDPRPAPPKVGDTRPTPASRAGTGGTHAASAAVPAPAPAPPGPDALAPTVAVVPAGQEVTEAAGSKSGGRARRRRGRDRRGRAVGRYMMCVHVRPHATQIAVLEGRTLVEHYVSRVSDDTNQIDGNIYRGRVQNVLPGMEAAFVDIGTPKNAVLYRGDVRYDRDDIESPAGASPRIEQMLRPGQTILCQVTKNPIGAKGARLTQEVSLPGRFAVLVPNSATFGIS